MARFPEKRDAHCVCGKADVPTDLGNPGQPVISMYSESASLLHLGSHSSCPRCTNFCYFAKRLRVPLTQGAKNTESCSGGKEDPGNGGLCLGAAQGRPD